MLKKLEEQRAELQTKLEELVNVSKTEERAFTEEEVRTFDETEAEIKRIDATIEAEKRAIDLATTQEVKPTMDETKKELTAEEVRAITEEEENKAFAEYVKGERRSMSIVDHTDDHATGGKQNAGSTAGDVIPETVSNDIIKSIVDRSSVLGDIAMVNSTGTYKQIVEADKITAGWTDELADVTASDANWETVEIGHEKLGSLAKISLELLNQADIDVASEVKTQMTDAFADKLEAAVFNGTGTKQPTGLFSGGTPVALASASAITADEVINIFYGLKSTYRTNAKWYMSNKTLLAIRKLKDSTGQYLFHEAELTSDYDGHILGKPVSVSDQMNDFEIIFGDIKKAYKGNMNPNMIIQTLNEKYADQGAKGILGFLFFDGKPVNNQAYVAAKN